MLIRHEDKEFIQALSLFGALLGACAGVFVVVHISNRVHQQYSVQNEYQQNHAALLKLSSTVANPNNPIADENVLDQVQQQIEQIPAPKVVAEESFWTCIPRWGYLGFCGGGGVLGALGGYYGTWTTGWCGTIFICYFIRFLYKIIRRVAPESAVKIHLPPVSGEDEQSHYCIPREDGRILPTLIKLFFLLLFLLGILAVIVWRLTAI